MKVHITFIVLCYLLVGQLSAQYKYDNTLFKTVFIEDLCDALQKNPGYLLLDVRTPGEFSDTSSSASLNIGHLKGAKNLDINELQKRWKELLPYKDQPIFVYCSHSQRSRRVSKFLTDSGFTKINNVNGAMTEFNLEKYNSIQCANDLYQTSHKFKLLPPTEVAKLISKNKKLFILDVREDSIFRGISTDPIGNAQGKFKGAVNIPFAALSNSLNKIPKENAVLVVADYGRETNLAAKLLTDSGYTNISAAFNGMDQWISTSVAELPQKNKLWQQKNSFDMINAEDMDAMLKKKNDIFILDVRTVEEFTNQVKKEPWKNRGHVKGAVNIPNAELKNHLKNLEARKNKDIIIYSFSTNPESFEAAKFLTDNGFSKVHVLLGGLFDIRWKAANIKGRSDLNNYVEDVPPDNL